MAIFKRQLNVTKQGGLVPSLFKGWKEWKVGDMLMAEYVSTKMTMFQGKETPNHLVKVLECNFTVTKKDGTTVDPTEQMLTLNSAGQINKLLEGVSKGQAFQFVYEGKQRSTNPKDTQSYHTFSDLALGDVDGGESDDDYDL